MHLSRISLFTGLLLIGQQGSSQPLYFPPSGSGEWETTDPTTLGWCTDQLPPLLQFLDDSNTKAFIVLKDGRIVIEHYFGTFTQDSVWYWASAGKSLTAFLVGRAQQEGLLEIDDPTSDHLGAGWTSLTAEQEEAITIRHQLTMTTGLDDGVAELDCTDPYCLHYLADPGTRWSYHNAPYTLLDGVIEAATGQTMNAFLFTRLTQTTGITGAYINVGYNNVFFSKPRSMARFGILMQAEGVWNGSLILSDMAYYDAMITPSQQLNEAYGYLWWLNGAATYMLPQTQVVFEGPPLPNAPLDAFNALGKDGQILNVSPAEGLVVVRMGAAPGGVVFVPTIYNDQIWQYLNAVICGSTATSDQHRSKELQISPNPVSDALDLRIGEMGKGILRITDVLGRIVIEIPITSDHTMLDLTGYPTGSYFAHYQGSGGSSIKKFLKQ